MLGADRPMALYCPSAFVTRELTFIIGEFAVNVIIFPCNGVEVLVSIRLPDKLWAPCGRTEYEDMFRIKEVVCLTVL